MNGNLNQKKESVIEEALKLKDEGKRLSYIIEKFPDYESEIREVFGMVAFVMGNTDKLIASKNILKTLLSKMPDDSPAQAASRFQKEIAQENNVHGLMMEDEEDNEVFTETENNLVFGKWKIIIPVIILAIAMGVMLLRSDSRMKDEIINENIETPQNSDELNSVSNTGDISSSTEKENN